MQRISERKAIIRLREKTRPISGETIGFRLQAATPNQAARKMRPIKDKKTGELKGFQATDQMTTAFTREYLVLETGDYTNVSERDLERFKSSLKTMGFTHAQWSAKDALPFEL